MRPKEKAKELVELYCQLLSIRDYENNEKAKQCALIAVDVLIKENYPRDIKRCEYFNEVKREIEKL